MVILRLEASEELLISPHLVVEAVTVVMEVRVLLMVVAEEAQAVTLETEAMA